MMPVEGRTDAEVIETFVERILAKNLRHGEIAVFDNVGAPNSDVRWTSSTRTTPQGWFKHCGYRVG
jgi:hypothetical protein